jgi:hypothetical protein
MEYEFGTLVNGFAAWAAIIAGLFAGSWRRAIFYGLFCFVTVTVFGVLAGLLPNFETQVASSYEMGRLFGKVLAAVFLGLFGHAVRRVVIWIVRKLRGTGGSQVVPGS